jgi:iron-sulfur cluster assembly accessory protein
MVTFTYAAIKKLEDSLDPDDIVRVGVVGGGCSGLSYTIEVDENTNPDDVIIDLGKIKVYLNPYSSFQLRETVVDYVESLHQSGFKFENPKAVKSCACGTSFKAEKDSPTPPAGGCVTAGCPA